MKRIIKDFCIGFLIVGAMGIAILCAMAEFQAIQKRFPDMSFMDYLLIGDKLIIPSKYGMKNE